MRRLRAVQRSLPLLRSDFDGIPDVVLPIAVVKLSNQRKGAAIVLGLGVLALGLDRFVFRAEDSGPAAANASPIDAAPAAAAAPTATDQVSSAPQGPTLSDLLEKHRGSSSIVGDAFAVPAEWVVAAKVEKAIEQIETPKKDAIDPLLSRLKLSAVSQGRTESTGTAIVNGQTLIVGQEHDLVIGSEKYAVILQSVPAHDTAILKFVSSSREVTITRASGSENHARSSR